MAMPSSKSYIELITYIAGEVYLDEPDLADIVKRALVGTVDHEALLILLQLVWDSGRFTGIEESKEANIG